MFVKVALSTNKSGLKILYTSPVLWWQFK